MMDGILLAFNEDGKMERVMPEDQLIIDRSDLDKINQKLTLLEPSQ